MKDAEEERTLRPQSLDDFIGQDRIIEHIRIFVEAAKMRDEPVDHILFFGPPGLGKTTLANIVAKEMGRTIHNTSGPIIEKRDDLAAIFTDLNRKDVLFIDEIHRLNKTVEEWIYPAIEDFRLDILIGEGPHARNVQLDLEHFTLIGATTRAGMISGPLRSRFGIIERLDMYDTQDIMKIIYRTAKILDIEIRDDGALTIAQCSRGTPRIANRILKRVRDYAQVKADGIINETVSKQALQLLDIDHLGLDNVDRNYLKSIIDLFEGGPVGLNNISVSIDEDEDTIEDMIEPYLIQIGFIKRTKAGRVATAAAYRHLGINLPKTFFEPEDDLFGNDRDAEK